MIHRSRLEVTFTQLGRALALAFLGALAVAACRTGTDPDDEKQISLQLDSVPLLVLADSTSAATIWATVLQGSRPIADSTVVQFATSLGRIDPEGFTRDGLARVTFVAGRETGVAAIVAQSRGVRDTVLITLY